MANDMFLPVRGVTQAQLADTFGAARSGGRSHKGIDIFADEGTDVVAVKGGTVVRAGDSGGLGGLRVWVKDDEGRFHYYAHMNGVSVKDGQRVEAGQKLGGVGKTGNARNTPPHLHYSVNSSSTRETGEINPYEYLTGALPAEKRDPLLVRHADSQTGGLSTDPQEIEAQERLQNPDQFSSRTMFSIMEAVSEASLGRGGEVHDLRDFMFGRDNEPEEAA